VLILSRRRRRRVSLCGGLATRFVAKAHQKECCLFTIAGQPLRIGQISAGLRWWQSRRLGRAFRLLERQRSFAGTRNLCSGHKQYRYHARWREMRDENKYQRMMAFAQALPALRASVQRDLTLIELPRAKVLATVVRLLESTHIRVGILKPFAANVTAIRRLSRHIHPARSAAMRALAACVPLLLDQNYLLKKRRSSLF